MGARQHRYILPFIGKRSQGFPEFEKNGEIDIDKGIFNRQWDSRIINVLGGKPEMNEFAPFTPAGMKKLLIKEIFNSHGLWRLCENDEKMNRPGIYARYKIYMNNWALAQLFDI